MKTSASPIGALGNLVSQPDVPASPYSRENVRAGVLHYLFGRGMSAVAGFLTVILLVRYMDTHAYAGYAAMLGVSVIAGMLAGLGMERALARFIPEGRLHYPPRYLAAFIRTSALLRLGAMLLIVGLLYLAWPWLTGQFPGIDFGPVFPLALAFLLLNTSMFQFLSAVLQALVQQKSLTRVMVVQWGGRLLCILLLVLHAASISLEQALWLMAIPDGIGALILWCVIRRYLASLPADLHAERETHWPSWPQVRRLALDNYAYNLVAALPQGSSMIILAAAFLAAPFVAAYGFFISLLERCKQYLPLQFMLNLAEPVLIAAYVKDRDFDRLCHHNRLLYKFNLLFIMPALAWVAAIAPQLTSLLTGGKYAEHAWLLPVLLLQLALGSHATVLQIVINAVGKSTVLSISGFSALLSMGFAILLAVAGGRPEYLVLAPLLYEFVNNAVAVAALRGRGYRYDPQILFHAKLLASTALAWLLANEVLRHFTHPAQGMAMAALTVVPVFVLANGLLRTVDARDFQTLKNLLRS